MLAAIRICPLAAAKQTPWPSQSVTGFASQRTATLPRTPIICPSRAVSAPATNTDYPFGDPLEARRPQPPTHIGPAHKGPRVVGKDRIELLLVLSGISRKTSYGKVTRAEVRGDRSGGCGSGGSKGCGAAGGAGVAGWACCWEDREKELSELIQVSFADRFVRRRLERQLGDIADSVERRLEALITVEYRGLADSDRAAVFAEVVSALERADLSDAALLGDDADPVKLARRVRACVPSPAGLGEAGLACSRWCWMSAAIAWSGSSGSCRSSLRGPPPRRLSRLSGLAEQVAVVLERLPPRSLDAPKVPVAMRSSGAGTWNTSAARWMRWSCSACGWRTSGLVPRSAPPISA